MYSRALAAVAVLFVVACSNKVVLPGLESDVDGLKPIQCDPDNFNSLDQTRPATLGQTEEDTVCPRADQDYWKLTGVGGPKQLLSVDLLYDKLSAIELQADVWGPRGRCMPNALTACTTNTQCAPTFDFCDTARGGCRMAQSPVCFANTDCGAGESCYGSNTAVEQIAQVRIAPSSVLQHRLTANYPAFAQGDYTVVVYDHAEQEEEPTVQYKLTVTQETDPDNNEPNDLPNLATTLTSGTAVQGAMSYVNDVDWFVITPAFATPAVVKVDLSYSGTSAIAPTWTIIQGNFQYIGPDTVTEGSGGSAIRRQRTAVVTPTNAPVYIRVENAATATNTTERYTLLVEVRDDPQEGAIRNDDVLHATNVSAGAGSAAGTSVYNQADRTLVAVNDADWYRISRTSTPDNTLLYFLETASASAPYSLVFQFYKPTATACSNAVTNPILCSQGRPCSQENVCLDLMAQRPAPDGPGDPQQGGLSPNYIETQLPMQQDIVYVRAVHNASTTLPVEGHDFDQVNPYHFQVKHLLEPDDGDRINSASSPDNIFLARPFNAQAGDFNPKYRTLGGSQVVVSAPSPGNAIAVPQNNSIAATGTCTVMTLEVFDGLGRVNAAAANVTIAASTGTVLAADCLSVAPSPFTTSSGTVQFGLDNPATTNLTITTTTNGGASVTSPVPYATNTTITFTSVANGAANHGAQAGASTQPIRIRLPAATATPLTLTFGVSGGGHVTCPNGDQNGHCPGYDGTGSYCDPINAVAGCHVIIPAGQQVYDIRGFFPSSGAPGVLTVTGGSGGKFTWAVYAPGSVTTVSNGYTIQGYLSYDGDQDFFEVPLTNIAGGGLSIWVDFAASEIDLRAQATRGGGGSGVGLDRDVAMLGCGSGSPNVNRQTCHQVAFIDSAGPAPGVTSPECVYTGASGNTPIQIWVNDTNSNDWDTVNAYTIRIEYTEGCPGVCPAAACQ